MISCGSLSRRFIFWTSLTWPGSTNDTTVPSACSGRAAGTVDVGGVLIDRVEVNHTLDCVDMNASGGDIGGDQCRCLAPGEVVEGLAVVGFVIGCHGSVPPARQPG